jgi:hypothetical protein
VIAPHDRALIVAVLVCLVGADDHQVFSDLKVERPCLGHARYDVEAIGVGVARGVPDHHECPVKSLPTFELEGT